MKKVKQVNGTESAENRVSVQSQKPNAIGWSGKSSDSDI